MTNNQKSELLRIIDLYGEKKGVNLSDDELALVPTAIQEEWIVKTATGYRVTDAGREWQEKHLAKVAQLFDSEAS